MIETTSRTDRAVDRDRRESSAIGFLFASVVITAMIFVLINVVVHFSGRAYTAGAVVTAPSPVHTGRAEALGYRSGD